MGKKITFSAEDVAFVYNLLRQGSITWSGRKECLSLARKKVLVRHAKNGNPVYKLKWQCADCMKWFPKEQDMEVDHVTEIGGVSSFNGDMNDFVDRILPRPVSERLQCLCKICHLRKTKVYSSARIRWKRKNEVCR